MLSESIGRGEETCGLDVTFANDVNENAVAVKTTSKKFIPLLLTLSSIFELTASAGQTSSKMKLRQWQIRRLLACYGTG
jgi:hypothetical protein